VLDTETTGLDPAAGHRVIEIGCVELENHIATDRSLQVYLDPERDIPEDSFRIHGISGEFLAGKPKFAEIADEFLAFIAEDTLVIHNAEFDLKFLNAELARCGLPPIPASRAIDTVALARQRFPGAQANLNALCRRFEIDLSDRGLHGALVDCQLLAAVYLELRGGRQPDFALESSGAKRQTERVGRAARPARPHLPSEEEQQAHAAMLQRLNDPIWRS